METGGICYVTYTIDGGDIEAVSLQCWDGAFVTNCIKMVQMNQNVRLNQLSRQLGEGWG